MSVDSREDRWFSFRVDVAGAVVGLILAILMLPLRLFAAQIFITTLPIVLGLACLCYLLTVYRDESGALPTLSPGMTRLLPAVTFVGLAAMVVVAVHQARSSLFYYLAVWTGIVVLAQIVFGAERELHAGLLLAQVVLLGYVVRLAGAVASPGYVGIDVWTHVANWAAAIKEANSLAPIATEKYYASPLFHLLVVVSSQLFGLPLRQALILSVGVAMPLAVLLVYATASHLVSKRWAVFAAAAFGISGRVIEWGIHLIPTSLGLLFFLAVLFALTRLLTIDHRARDFGLLILFSVAVILTHQISAFIMLVYVGASIAAKLLLATGLLRPERPRWLGASVRESANLSGLLVFDLGLITFMWSLTPYQGSSFLETLLIYVREAVLTSAGFLNLAGSSGSSGSAGGGGAGPAFMQEVAAYVDATGFLLMLLITIVGSLALIHRKRTTHAAVTNIVAIVVMLVFIFGFPLFGIQTFVPARWFAFLAAPLAIVGAVGVGYLADNAGRSVAVAVLLVFVVAFPATATISSDATLDDPALDGVQTRYSYTEREIAAAETFADVTTNSPAEPLATDHPYNTMLQRGWDVQTEAALVSNGTSPNGSVVYREYDRSGAEYFVGSNGRPYQPVVAQSELCRGRDVAYDNGDVALCHRGVGPTG